MMEMQISSPNYFVVDPDQLGGTSGFIKLKSRSTTQSRALLTSLSDEQLYACGLQIEERRADANVWLEFASNIKYSTSALVSKWLVEQPANDIAQTEELRQDWIEQLSARLEELKAAANEEGVPFQEASQAAAFDFAKVLFRATRPSAFLAGNGNVRLVWLNDSGEQVALQFLNELEVQFVLFKKRKGRLAHIMGVDLIADMLEMIAGIGLMHILHGE